MGYCYIPLPKKYAQLHKKFSQTRAALKQMDKQLDVEFSKHSKLAAAKWNARNLPKNPKIGQVSKLAVPCTRYDVEKIVIDIVFCVWTGKKWNWHSGYTREDAKELSNQIIAKTHKKRELCK